MRKKTMRSRLREVVNVRDYGALTTEEAASLNLPDQGAAINQAAFQSALDAVVKNRGRVLIPAGEFKVPAPLTLKTPRKKRS